ncbi:MAG: dihydroxy-acid dehydratase family protein [Rhizobiaceae bacterium]|nr:dihydroxy-acid dehydratase family protein [Rhizobiaceae bacterium]|tara:strand:+ start:101020 stop:102789 length:1770 start_codon:yes stop_codon:yes gene_type:complete
MTQSKQRLRSQDWFDNPDHADLTALYLERFMNYGITPDELRSGRPIIGIAQSGSDLAPCNRGHLAHESRIRDGIRDAGGIPIVFPTHPIFENCRRPTAALDRNLAYLGLVEIMNGYPLDGVVLTTGCDKTTPSALMAASTVDIPAIVLSGGPMLDGWHNGERVGSGTVIWRARRKLSAGEITRDDFLDEALDSAPSAGHCNTMGTALTMNAMAEALGMSLPGCAAIPAPFRERGQIAFRTGMRIVEMVREDLCPSDILTKKAFVNAINTCAALGGSTNAQPHLNAMALHAGLSLSAEDWSSAYDIPLLANVQPSGEYLGESFHRAGGVPSIMRELMENGRLDGNCRTVSGETMSAQLVSASVPDGDVIRSYMHPLKERAGFLVLRGNLFDFAIMKTSVISDAFAERYLSNPEQPGVFEARAVVFESSDDYLARINDPALNIDAHCILVIRGAGPLGWPGSAEVVNMQPPDHLLKIGISSLPTLGDGRQSGTADSPSILNASPESAAGGGLSLLRTDDVIRIDIKNGSCDMLVDAEELRRRDKGTAKIPEANTPWEKIYRENVAQLEDGGILKGAQSFRATKNRLPRHNH